MAGHIPKPFNRPSINLDSAYVPREWSDHVPWWRLEVGDLVVDLGVVVSIEKTSKVASRIEFPNASILASNTHLVKAFVKTHG
jgi:hypothetical protein